jgi:hypothetical protein
MDAADHVGALAEHGLAGAIDVVLVNAAPLPADLPAVRFDAAVGSRIEGLGPRVVSADLADPEQPLHHHPDRLYEALSEVW